MTPARLPLGARWWLRVYSVLVTALPRSVRNEYAGEMLGDLEMMLERAGRRGGVRVGIVGVRACLDLLFRIPNEHVNALRPLDGEGGRESGRSLDPGERMMNATREMKLAARALMRRPGFTVVAVLTLALGIGANAAIYSVVNSVLLRPLPYPDSEDIVMVQHHAPGIELPTLTVSSGLMNFYWESADFFEPLGSYSRAQRNLTGGDRPAQVDVLMATPELFDVLRVRPAAGRAFHPDDVVEGASAVAILTDAGWRSRFGADPTVIGRTIELDGVPTEVVGIMPESFAFSDPAPTLLSPLLIDPEGAFGQFGTAGLARLAPGVSVEAAAQRLADLQARIPERFPNMSQEFLEQAGWSSSVEPWRDVIVADVESTLWIVLGTVGLVLLIACANVANLFLVRAEGRQKEMAIRAAMGAGRRSVAASLLSESLLLGVVGGVVGVFIAWVGLTALVSAGPTQLPRLHEVGIDWTTIGFAALLSVVAGFGFGALSWLRYSGGRLAGILRDGGRGSTAGRERHRARNVLVASQLALALVLLVGSGLMLRSFAQLSAIDPGFESEGVLAVGLSYGETEDRPSAARFYQAVATEVASLPGVESVGITTRVPLSNGNANGGSYRIESRPRDDAELPPVAMYRAIGPGYFATMGIEILEGRDMVAADVADAAPVVWVNATFARDHLGGQALGERIAWDEGVEFAEIVGVVEDTKEFELTDEKAAWAYLPLVIADWGYPELHAASLVIGMTDGRSGESLVPSIRDIVSGANPNVPLTTTESLEAVLSRSMAATSFAMVLLGIATAVALFLGAIGLFGVISYVVSERTREIGVRVALGAGAGQVSGMVVRQALMVTVVGAGLGLAGAFGATRLMEALLYEVSATDPITFVVAPVLLVGVSLLASWLPARRAARVDPVTALRAE